MQKDLAGRIDCLDFEVNHTLRPLPMRADVFLTRCLPKRSRSHLQKLFREARVLVDSTPAEASRQLRGGESVRLLLPREFEFVDPASIALDIVHEDARMLVLNKSPGIIVHPAGRTVSGTLINAVHHLFQQRGEAVRPTFLHRLDRDTSGLIILPKDLEAHRHLQQEIVRHRMKKVYLAICEAPPEPNAGLVDAPLGFVPHPFVKKMGVVPEPEGRVALTAYTTVSTGGGGALLGLALFTGRQHQIRVHLAHLGRPILGDVLYGGRPAFSRQALHAYYLAFRHPDGHDLELYAPLPEDFRLRLRDGFAGFAEPASAAPWNPGSWLEALRGVKPPVPAVESKKRVETDHDEEEEN